MSIGISRLGCSRSLTSTASIFKTSIGSGAPLIYNLNFSYSSLHCVHHTSRSSTVKGHTTATMTSQAVNVNSLTYIRPETLSSQLSSSTESDKVAIIDVRDNDYLGGHIKSSIHAPIDQLDARMPELLRTCKDKERVVFHCMLSQQRGPKAALAYAKAKAREAERDGKGIEKGEDGNVTKIGGQEICVLEGGFGQWQSRYGNDKNLTEGYVKELWESVFG